MNYFVILLVTSLSSFTVKGQCPFSAASSAVTTCDGSSKAGSEVYIDFHSINSPCTCTVIPSISGSLYVKPGEVTVSACTTTVEVGNTLIYRCPAQRVVSSLNVIENQPVTVTASYQPNQNSGAFFHCLGFYQSSNGVKVTCGSGSTTRTTTPEKTTVYINSAPMSSTATEIIISPTHQDNSTTVSNGLRTMCTELAGNKLTQMDEVSYIHLQIPLALFVVTAVVSVIVNIYLFIKLRQRNDSKSQQKQNTSRRVNHRVSNQSAADAYTDLDVTNITTEGENRAYTELNIQNHATGTTGGGNQAYTELDIASIARGANREGNQYDSMSPSRDYINLNAS